ncbi:MAG: oligosaccharide flippase family protein [Chitinophagales bacterium]|nr:oligosaccharide flippase family protein [Chitinophagales bacterium]
MKDSLKLQAEIYPAGKSHLPQGQSKMQNLANVVLKDTFIYGISRYLSLLAALFLTPIYTRILSKADYGVMDIYNIWIAMFLAIIPLGLMNGLLRFYPDVEKQVRERKKLISSILFTLLGISALFIIIAIIGKSFFIESIVGDKSFSGIYQYAVIIVALSVVHSFNLELLRIKMLKKKFLIVSITNFILLSLLGFALVYFYNSGIIGFFQASVFALVVSCLIGLYFNAGEITLSYDLRKTIEIIAYSSHFLSVFFFFHSTNLIDRYLITNLLNLDLNGIYAIGLKISGLLNFIIAAFSMAWMPYVFRIKDEANARQLFSKMFDNYLKFGGLLIFFIALFRQEFIAFFAPTYESAYHLISIMLIYFFVMGLTNVFTIGIQISKKTRFLTYSAIISIACNIFISIILVKKIGIEGIAIGSLCGAVVWIAIQHFFAQREYQIPFRYFKNGIIFLLLILAIVGLEFVDISSPAYKVIIMLVCVILTSFNYLNSWRHNRNSNL